LRFSAALAADLGGDRGKAAARRDIRRGGAGAIAQRPVGAGGQQLMARGAVTGAAP